MNKRKFEEVFGFKIKDDQKAFKCKNRRKIIKIAPSAFKLHTLYTKFIKQITDDFCNKIHEFIPYELENYINNHKQKFLDTMYPTPEFVLKPQINLKLLNELHATTIEELHIAFRQYFQHNYAILFKTLLSLNINATLLSEDITKILCEYACSGCVSCRDCGGKIEQIECSLDMKPNPGYDSHVLCSEKTIEDDSHIGNTVASVFYIESELDPIQYGDIWWFYNDPTIWCGSCSNKRICSGCNDRMDIIDWQNTSVKCKKCGKEYCERCSELTDDVEEQCPICMKAQQQATVSYESVNNNALMAPPYHINQAIIAPPYHIINHSIIPRYNSLNNGIIMTEMGNNNNNQNY